MKITRNCKSFTPAEAVRYKLQTVNLKSGDSPLEQKINNLCNMMARSIEASAFLRERGEKTTFLQIILGNDFTISQDDSR